MTSLSDLKERIETIFSLISENAKSIQAINIKVEKHLSEGKTVTEEISTLKETCKELTKSYNNLKSIYNGIKIERDTIQTMKKNFWIKMGIIATIVGGVAALAVYFK